MKRGHIGLKIIVAAVLIGLAIVIGGWAYRYTIELKQKISLEGFSQEQAVIGDWSHFKMYDERLEMVDCYIGDKDGQRVYKQYPISYCPADINNLLENRVIYEGFLLANQYFGGGFHVTEVYTGECPRCYMVGLSNGTHKVSVDLNGLIEENVKLYE